MKEKLLLVNTEINKMVQVSQERILAEFPALRQQEVLEELLNGLEDNIFVIFRSADALVRTLQEKHRLLVCIIEIMDGFVEAIDDFSKLSYEERKNPELINTVKAKVSELNNDWYHLEDFNEKLTKLFDQQYIIAINPILEHTSLSQEERNNLLRFISTEAVDASLNKCKELFEQKKRKLWKVLFSETIPIEEEPTARAREETTHGRVASEAKRHVRFADSEEDSKRLRSEENQSDPANTLSDTTVCLLRQEGQQR